MGKPTTSITLLLLLVQSLLVLQLLTTAFANRAGDAASSSSKICKVEVTDLAECLPAVTGKSPPMPTAACCGVIGKVNMRCLCKYKSQLRGLGVDPATAMGLPKKCGLKAPSKC